MVPGRRHLIRVRSAGEGPSGLRRADGPGRGERPARPKRPGDGPPDGPVRTCVGCRRRADQSELIRLVRGPDGSLLVGRTRPGRGAWLCRGRPSCLDVAERRGAFSRALRAPVRAGALDELRSVLAAESAAPGPNGD